MDFKDLAWSALAEGVRGALEKCVYCDKNVSFWRRSPCCSRPICKACFDERASFDLDGEGYHFKCDRPPCMKSKYVDLDRDHDEALHNSVMEM